MFLTNIKFFNFKNHEQRTFSFDTIPWQLANEASFTSSGTTDYSNLSSSANITFLITLFGAPVNP